MKGIFEVVSLGPDEAVAECSAEVLAELKHVEELHRPGVGRDSGRVSEGVHAGARPAQPEGQYVSV